MKLKHIILHNYRQHRDREADFEGSLIALIGANGHGKSNFLGAIQFALTGEQPPFKKADLISWGEEDGYVDLQFEDALGRPCEIFRRIKKAECRLTIGEEVISGAAKVADALDQMMGIDKDLFRQVVFVHQAELDSILFEEPRQRELAFQKLMGIGEADKIYKTLGDVLTQFGKADFDEQLTMQKERLAEQKTAIVKSEEAIRDMEEAIAKYPDEQTLKEAYNTCETQLRDWQAWETVYKTWDKALADLAALATVDPNPELENVDESGLLERKAKLDVLIQDKRRFDTLAASQQEIRSKLKTLLPQEAECLSDEELDSLEKAFEELKACILGAKGQEEALRKFIVEEDSHICPLCGSVTDEDISKKVLDRIAELDVPGITKTSQELETQYQDARKKKEAIKKIIDGLVEQERVVSSDLSRMSPDLARMDLVDLEAERTAITGLLTAYRQHVKDTKQYADQKAYLTKTASEAKKSLGELTIEEISRNIQQLKADKDLYWGQISQVRGLTTSLAQYKGEVSGVRKLITDLEAYIAKLEEDKKLNEELMERVAVIQNVRNWFHYANGPRTISTTVMQRLNEDVNRFLGEFTAPFTVEPLTEGVGFKVRFTDGRIQPADLPDASVLSGGQKVQLAVAFRLATYCTFASKLGLLVLDEPTAYLDEANVECFGELMSKVSQIAQNIGVQIIIATHEKGIVGQFSSVIEL